MKKLFILLSVIILFLSVTTVSAGLFGFGTIECNQFSIDIPSGFAKTDGWSDKDNHENYVYLGNGVATGDKTHRWFDMTEILSNKDKQTYDKVVVENYTENNLLVEKCHSEDANDNFTYAEFDKDYHNYVITISWENDLEKLNLADDVELIKNVVDSTNHK